jgi:hypothetical protein
MSGPRSTLEKRKLIVACRQDGLFCASDGRRAGPSSIYDL